jgi:predicted Zn-dependent protease
MKKVIITCLITCLSNAPSHAQVDQRTAEVLDQYNQSIQQFVGYESCGHLLDGPATVYKRVENLALDRMISFTPEEEASWGMVFHQKLLDSLPIVKDHWFMNDLSTIVNKLSQYTQESNREYKAYIFESDQPNAFTILGGHIYVTTGLINFVSSKDEMAFILGHEISHNERSHSLRKIKKLYLASSVGDLTNLEDLASIALNINLLLSAPFDQIDEYDADQNGVYLMQKAGYDLNRSTDFFDKMMRLESQNILSKITRTHPYSEHRKKCIVSYLEDNN